MHRYVGISLIEILISFLLLSTIIFGFSAMQLTTLRAVQHSYDKLYSAQEASVVMERGSDATH